jgi:hypothetical protein
MLANFSGWQEWRGQIKPFRSIGWTVLPAAQHPRNTERTRRSVPAASVSGHRSWSSLKRYTHLRQTGDKYEGWKWKAL